MLWHSCPPILRKENEMNEVIKPKCCKIGCDKDAKWQIVYGASTDDVTESCAEHIDDLLPDADEYRLYRF